MAMSVSLLSTAAVATIACLLLPNLLLYLLRYYSQDQSLKGNHQVADVNDENSASVSQEPDVSEGWWTSEQHLALEKRALFSKAWIQTAHVSSFPKSGAYVSVNTPAGYPIFLVKGKDDVIRAFHNVCRHRAYTITTKPTGSSLVLGCRYHGWSYDTKGKLVKAPKFENVPGFDKEANSLFEVKCVTNGSGLVLVNLDFEESAPEPPLLEWLGVTSTMTVQDKWEVEGAFNWKLAESASCFDITAVDSAPASVFAALHLAYWSSSYRHSQELLLSHVVSSSRSGAALLLDITPLSAGKCNVSCTLLSSQKSTMEPDSINKTKSEVTASVMELERIYQDIKVTGATMDVQGQQTILADVVKHAKAERAAGKKMYPATRQDAVSATCKIADEICSELEAGAASSACGTATASSLAW
ncbi:hypothetical protein AAFC00_003906 [Neodothiora populina]|uniref:Rieske domain-containing protein n=1 Tax=Neodothiora populina TaxID=2781224 RepID=A0ABR3PFV3_9PEZI